MLHDLGNPPFGHVGEEIIKSWFKDNLNDIKTKAGKKVSDILNKNQIEDLENFDGNAQALRILLKSRYKSEINLPYSIISVLIKYPTRCYEIEDKKTVIRRKTMRKKMGCFQAENDVFLKIAKEVGTINSEEKVIRHPLAYLVEAADDIAYLTADLEDAVKSGIVSVDELLKFFRKSHEKLKQDHNENDYNMKITDKAIEELAKLNKAEKDKTKVMNKWGTYLKRWLMYVACFEFTTHYDNILQGTFEYHLLHDNFQTLTVKLLRDAMEEYVFNSHIITEPGISAQTILGFLLDKFVSAIVQYDNAGKITHKDNMIITLIPENYIDDFHEANKHDHIKDDEAELLYRRILTVTDFISGMTDGYAKALYKKMHGIG